MFVTRASSDSPVVHQHDTQVSRDELKKFGRLALDGLIKQVLSGHKRLSLEKDKNINIRSITWNVNGETAKIVGYE